MALAIQFLTKNRLKGLFFSVFILFIMVFFIAQVHASAELVVEGEGTRERSFKFVEGESPASITFRLRETTGDSDAFITIYSDNPTDSETTKFIDANKAINIFYNDTFDATEEFILNKSKMVKIDVEINTTDVDPGTYNAKIWISYLNASSIEIPYKIQIRGPILWAVIVNGLGVVAGFVGTLLGLNINTSELNRLGLNQSENSKNEKKGIINRIRQSFRTVTLSYRIQTSPQNLNKTIFVWAARLLGLVIAIVISFVAFYSQSYDFGSQPWLDYANAFLFGLAQWGLSDVLGKGASKV